MHLAVLLMLAGLTAVGAVHFCEDNKDCNYAGRCTHGRLGDTACMCAVR